MRPFFKGIVWLNSYWSNAPIRITTQHRWAAYVLVRKLRSMGRVNNRH